MNYSVFSGQAKAMQTFVLATALALGTVGVTHAESTPKTDASTSSSASFDANNDGSVSSEEATAQGMPAQVFKDADANRDGKLSPDELSSAMSTSAPSAPSTGEPK